MSKQQTLDNMFNAASTIASAIRTKCESDEVFARKVVAAVTPKFERRVDALNAKMEKKWPDHTYTAAAGAKVTNAPKGLVVTFLKMSQQALEGIIDHTGKKEIAALVPDELRSEEVSKAFKKYDAPILSKLFAPK